MIYFITARQIGRVKIGYSSDPERRLKQFQDNCPPAPLALEAVCEGDLAFEKELHRIFGFVRKHGEWFELDASIEAAIQFLRDGQPSDANAVDYVLPLLLKQHNIPDKLQTLILNEQQRLTPGRCTAGLHHAPERPATHHSGASQ